MVVEDTLDSLPVPCRATYRIETNNHFYMCGQLTLSQSEVHMLHHSTNCKLKDHQGLTADILAKRQGYKLIFHFMALVPLN